ncbi:MAG: type IV toxin-antitoxin system AbiEi family antitoxin domain-containing protein [Thermomicrobiales bacterium]
MGDTMREKPDHRCLFDAASEQMGHFTAAQARTCGFAWDTLSDGAKRGTYLRIRRGLYRLRDYPSSPREEVMSAWLAVGKDVAIVSHESALDLLDLSDVIPNSTHLTVPRSKRHPPDLPGVTIHTSVRPIAREDITFRDGLRLTSVARTIADCATAGTGPEQIVMAVGEALERGITTPQRLQNALFERSRRVSELIRYAIGSTQ